MSELRYLIEDTGERVDEKKLREMLIKEEVDDIRNNFDDYMKGFLNYENQLEYLRDIPQKEIKDVIYDLNCNWNIPVREMTKRDWNIEHIEDKIREMTEMTDFEEWNTTKEFVDGYIKGLEYALSEIKGE